MTFLLIALGLVALLILGHVLYEAHLARQLLRARQALTNGEWDRIENGGVCRVLRLSASEVFDLQDRTPVQRQFLLRGRLSDAGFDLAREIHQEHHDFDGSVVFFQEKVEGGMDLEI